jgi:hypothetical protein
MTRSERSAERERLWRSMVDQQRQAGQTVRAFCREKEISEPSFYAWRRTLKRRAAEPSPDATSGTRRAGAGRVKGAASRGGVTAKGSRGRLIPVEVIAGRRSAEGEPDGRRAKEPLEIITPGGFTLRFDRDTRPETVACLLEVIGRCHREGAASC